MVEEQVADSGIPGRFSRLLGAGMVAGYICHNLGHDLVAHARSRLSHHSDEVGCQRLVHQEINPLGKASDVVRLRRIAANQYRAPTIAKAIAYCG